MAEKNQVATQNNGNVATQRKLGIAGYLGNEAVKKNIANVVGEKNVTKFISSIVSSVQVNKALSECTNSSILSAALLGEALQLTPSPQLGQYYMVPYDNKKTITDPETGRERKVFVKEAQFQIGYKGYIQLAIRSGQYRKIVASEVRQGEVGFYNPITEEFGMNPVLDIKQRQTLPVVGYYAMIELVNGFRKEIYWPKEQMQNHAETYSKGYANDLKKRTQYTFWSKNFDAMAKKTLIRQIISKWGIMSIEMQRAYEADMAVLDEDGNPHYVDNEYDIIDEVQEEIEQNANQTEFQPQIEEKPAPPTVPNVTKEAEKEPAPAKDRPIPEFMKAEEV